MKISICIPQYNRIHYLLKSLRIIEQQTYPDIEVCISDDCSSDETVLEIEKLKTNYKYPVVFDKNPVNRGYDRNYRKCIEMASGEYAFVIGNDDSIQGANSIKYLVDFLTKNNRPDIGFCNMIEERTGGTFINRALSTKVIGYGPDIAIKNYSCFSFVGGLIYKKSVFDNYNTDKYDGSIYSQMYLGVFMISKGCTLFSIHEPLVIKDLLLDGVFRKSYRDRISKKWRDFRVVDGGLPSVINVLINGIKDSNTFSQARCFYIFKRIYSITYPHWILDYKENGAFPEAVGLIAGLNPLKNPNYSQLNLINKIILYFIYVGASILSLITPVFAFKKYKHRLYTFFKG
jgi:glycosyltransferase involved in cell wall biosynthesis